MACQVEGIHAVAAARKRTILVVDDEIFVRLLIADELREAGYHVIEAVSADEALAILRSEAMVDLVFSDVRMPGTMDGIALARTIRTEYPSIKVMLASGHLASIHDVDHDGYFVKPYDIAQVLGAIQSRVG
jgi:CheY-like chemotaxis protein